jgi:hypothetical protein
MKDMDPVERVLEILRNLPDTELDRVSGWVTQERQRRRQAKIVDRIPELKAYIRQLASTQHFCYEPPTSRNNLIGQGIRRCHRF